MLHNKELTENDNIRSEMSLHRVAEMLRTILRSTRICNVTGTLAQPLDPMDITDKKIIEIVLDSLKTLLEKLCRGCGKNNRKFLSISQDIITLALIVGNKCQNRFVWVLP